MIRRLSHAVGAVALALAAGLAGCASSSTTASGGGTAARGDRYVITAAELRTVSANNLYDAIRKLRPDYFRQRGNDLRAQQPTAGAKGNGPVEPQSSSTGSALARADVPIKVYQNDQLMTSVEDLRQLPIAQTVEVRFLPGPQAVIRYGTSHSSGAILVRTQ